MADENYTLKPKIHFSSIQLSWNMSLRPSYFSIYGSVKTIQSSSWDPSKWGTDGLYSVAAQASFSATLFSCGRIIES